MSNTSASNTSAMREWSARPREQQRMRTSVDGDGVSAAEARRNAAMDEDKEHIFSWFHELASYGSDLATYNRAADDRRVRAQAAAFPAARKGAAAGSLAAQLPQFPVLGAKHYKDS